MTVRPAPLAARRNDGPLERAARKAVGVFARKGRRFAGADGGAVAVEFAACMPILLLLWLGATELTQAVTVDRKTAMVADALADLTAREVDMSRAARSGLFNAGRQIMQPHEENPAFQMTLVSVAIDDQGRGRVVWSDSSNGFAPFARGSQYPVDPAFVVDDRAGCVVISTVTQEHRSVFLKWVFDSAGGLRGGLEERGYAFEYERAYIPRGVDCVRGPNGSPAPS